VELLPQSSAATASLTDVHRDDVGHADLARHDGANFVVGAHEKVREMCVQTFDSNPRPSHATRWLRAVVAHGRISAAFRVLVMGSLQHFCVDEPFETMDASATFEATDRSVQFGIDEPEERGHRRAVT
jgi:hypothetical protein